MPKPSTITPTVCIETVAQALRLLPPTAQVQAVLVSTDQLGRLRSAAQVRPGKFPALRFDPDGLKLFGYPLYASPHHSGTPRIAL